MKALQHNINQKKCRLNGETNSFGSSVKLLMNGLVSWHMWIKETFDKDVLRIIILFKRTNEINKTSFYDKLFDQFLN